MRGFCLGSIEILDGGLVYRGSEGGAHFRNAYWSSVVELGDVEAIANSKDSSIQNQKKLQFGFPCVIQLGNGDIFFVFWCVENGLSNIRWYRLKVDARVMK